MWTSRDGGAGGSLHLNRSLILGGWLGRSHAVGRVLHRRRSHALGCLICLVRSRTRGCERCLISRCMGGCCISRCRGGRLYMNPLLDAHLRQVDEAGCSVHNTTCRLARCTSYRLSKCPAHATRYQPAPPPPPPPPPLHLLPQASCRCGGDLMMHCSRQPHGPHGSQRQLWQTGHEPSTAVGPGVDIFVVNIS
jgi:hypothetical protein